MKEKNTHLWKIIKGLWWTGYTSIQNPCGTIRRVKPELDRVSTYDNDDRLSNLHYGNLVAPIPNLKMCRAIYQGNKILFDEKLVGKILLFLHKNGPKSLLYEIEDTLSNDELLKIYKDELIITTDSKGE